MKKVHSKRNSRFNARLMEKWGYKRDEEERMEEDSESIAEEESLDEGGSTAHGEAPGIPSDPPDPPDPPPDPAESAESDESDENLEEMIRREIRKALQKGGE